MWTFPQLLFAFGLTFGLLTSPAQQRFSEGNVWTPDNGDGTYTNPIIYADYSDPDVIRVGWEEG